MYHLLTKTSAPPATFFFVSLHFCNQEQTFELSLVYFDVTTYFHWLSLPGGLQAWVQERPVEVVGQQLQELNLTPHESVWC